jgi:hypothetical protein
VGIFVKEIYQDKFCDHCQRKTKHKVRESALDIVFICLECHKEQEMVKSFF